MTMDEIQIGDEIIKAKEQIEAILNGLEKAIGRSVTQVQLENIEVTRFDDPAPRFLRQVVIEVQPPPGVIGKA